MMKLKMCGEGDTYYMLVCHLNFCHEKYIVYYD